MRASAFPKNVFMSVMMYLLAGFGLKSDDSLKYEISRLISGMKQQYCRCFANNYCGRFLKASVIIHVRKMRSDSNHRAKVLISGFSVM